MLRLFTWVSGFAIGMILIAGLAVYWLTASDLDQAREQEARAVAKSAALSIATYIKQTNATLDKMALDSEVFTALLARNKTKLNLAAAKLGQYLPDSLIIRLLLPDIREPDETASPRMGFAGLEMVRQATTENPAPAIQGEKTERHLAIARKITYDDKVIGVILASLDYGFVKKQLLAAATKNVALELRQDNVALARAGNFNADKLKDLPVLSVPETNWSIAYESADLLGHLGFPIISAIVLPAFFGGLAFFIGYRRISELLAHDVNNLMKVFKDMMTNNLQGNYPFQLSELSALFSNLLQFKRVLEKGDPQTKLDDFQPKFDGAQPNNIFANENQLLDDFEITIDDEFDLKGLFDDNPPHKN